MVRTWFKIILCIALSYCFTASAKAVEPTGDDGSITRDQGGVKLQQASMDRIKEQFNVLDGTRISSESSDLGQIKFLYERRYWQLTATDTAKINEALSILKSLEVLQRNASSRKATGMTASVFGFAKDAFQMLFMSGPLYEGLPIPRLNRKLDRRLHQAIKLLEEEAVNRNPDAIYLLAEINFYGRYSHPRNYPYAFRRYLELSTINGNSSAQHMVGFIYATGLGGAVERDQSKALLYYTFAALGGDVRAEMAVAYRHHTAVSTTRNCDEAAFYYKKVADRAMAYWNSGPPEGLSLIRHSYRLADEEGGVYGEGASVSSSGVNAVKSNPNSDAHASLEDVIEYLDLMSKKGDLKAKFSLGRIYYDGSRLLNRDIPMAKKYFLEIARRYWIKDGKTEPSANDGILKIAGKAAGSLGRIFLRGEVKEQSFELAATWFERGVTTGDAVSQNGMGILHLNGWGVSKDSVKAAEYFKAAADQDYAPAEINLGKLYLDQGDTQIAIRYFELAARHGHIEAYYLLADMANQSIGRDRSCGMATTYYKIVAERVEPLVANFAESNAAYDVGDLETAVIGYMMAAEQGFETGQANVAYMLDESKSKLPLNSLLPFKRQVPTILKNPALGLIFWTRSAKQSNLDSMVKMGDYYMAGLGTEPDNEKAAACYNAAAEFLQSAQALWNLGWMHENGVGVEQDFHLAKRFYDQALETNKEAYLPVTLALMKLRVRSYWNKITNGRVNSIRDEPESKVEWSLSEWINNFLEADRRKYEASDDAEYQEASQQTLPGADDFLEDVSDEIYESLIILALAGILAFLVLYRQQRQLQNRRAVGNTASSGRSQANAAGNERRGQDQEGFQPRDDPGLGQWVAGGVGH